MLAHATIAVRGAGSRRGPVRGSRRCGAGAAAALLLVALSSPGLANTLSDPTLDAIAGTYRTYDISSIDARFTSNDLTFTITLTNAPVAPSANQLQGLSGFIDIDVDSNPGTGATANIDTVGGSFGSTGLMTEYYLDLFSESSNPGFVTLRDPINPMNTSQAPITYGASSFSITVPLSALGNDDGLVSYAVLVGDFGFATDQALDPMVVQMGGLPASSSPVPEPSTATLLGLALAGLAITRHRATRS